MLLPDGVVLVPDDEPDTFEAVKADIRVEGALITEIAPHLAPNEGEEVVPAGGMLIVPGLVNGHLHSSEALLKGRYDNLPLELWMLQSYPIVGASTIPPDLIYLRTLLVGLESLRAGVTCLVDDVIEVAGQSLEHLHAVFRAYDDLGIRANVSGNIMDRAFIDTIPFAREVLPKHIQQAVDALPVPTVDEYIQFSEEAFERFHGTGDGRLRYVVAPSGPQRCTSELLIEAADLARRHGSAYHIHVLETKLQAVTGHVMYSRTMVQELDALGVLADNVTLAHGVWLTDHDISLLARAESSVSHNPVSNLKLGAGVADYRRLRSGGVNVALGSDGLSSSDTCRMLDVVKAAALLHDVRSDDYKLWPRAAEVLGSATRGGAHSAGLGDQIGSIATGMKADLVMLSLDTIPFTPLNNPINQLVYSENGSSIRHVMVNGSIVIKDGHSTRVDEGSILETLRNAMPAFQAQQQTVEDLNEMFVPWFDEIYRACSAASFNPVSGISGVPTSIADHASDSRFQS